MSASRSEDVLRAFSRRNARPGDRLDLRALVRDGLDAGGVAQAVRGCAHSGYVIDRGLSAELTDAGFRAISSTLRPG